MTMTRTVLFVDNDIQHLLAYTEPLKDAGWRVLDATDVAAALDVISREPIDVAVLDMLIPRGQLPEFDTAGGRQTGLVLARRIRQTNPRAAIAFLTVTHDADGLQWCEDNPPATYIRKGTMPGRHFHDELLRLTQMREAKALGQLESMLGRFNHVVKQLGRRTHGRDPLIMNDEYDVQYCLHALLRIYFSDVREEECVPSQVGGASRVDFLLKSERIVIETKMMRKTLMTKKLGDELLVDIARYRSHPDCSVLVCFVYDPDRRIENPEGFKSDLVSHGSTDFQVRVVIAPAP